MVDIFHSYLVNISKFYTINSISGILFLYQNILDSMKITEMNCNLSN